MRTHLPSLARILSLTAVVWAAQGCALAEKPDWAGQPGGGKHQRETERRAPVTAGAQVEIRIGAYFGEAQRRTVREHYDNEFRAGSCPPGLAKKNNGCLPPGQARQWTLGQPLPREVVIHAVEPSISVRLGLPPAGYKYVRVASDILLIAVGTSMVVDAIKDLGRQ